MLGLLCGGLLLVGVGAGVAFAEYSSFTYGGQRRLDQFAERSQTLAVPLLAEGETFIESRIVGGYMGSQLKELGRIEASEAVPAGTVELQFRYKSAGTVVDCWLHDEENSREIELYWTGEDREVEMLMTLKDLILEDLHNRQLSDYQLDPILTEAVVLVNPADADRVFLMNPAGVDRGSLG